MYPSTVTMIATAPTMKSHNSEYEGMWCGEVATSPTPSPSTRATKRARQSLECEDDVAFAQWSMEQDWFDQGVIDNSWLDVGDLGLDASWLEGSDVNLGASWVDFTSTTTSTTPFGPPLGEEYDYVEQALYANDSVQEPARLRKMQTGCIPCLYVSVYDEQSNRVSLTLLQRQKDAV